MSATIFCKLCKTLAYSENGRFTYCECKQCYVDATPYYARYGGDPNSLIVLKKNLKFDKIYKIKDVTRFGDPYFIGCDAKVFYDEDADDIRLLIIDGSCLYKMELSYYEVQE